MKKLAIFDLDGTILDTLDDLVGATNYMLRKNGMPERTKEEVCAFVGNGIRRLICRAVPSGTPNADIDLLYSDFTDYYKDHCADNTKPYNGIIDIIKSLREKGILIAVVSNKADYAVKILCAKYFQGLVDTAVGECDGVRRKPSPDSVNTVLEKLNINRSDSVYIGDSDVDIETAKNAKMDCISVCWGFRDKQFLIDSGANDIVSAPNELIGRI